MYRNKLFLEHRPGYDHPESPERLQVIYRELDREEIGSCCIYPEFAPASTDIIALNHSQALIDRVAATAGHEHDFLDADTRTSAESYAAACLAAGALVDAVDRLGRGEIDNAFCLVRPPGHHAERDRSMGFCLFNNVAIAARWALEKLGCQRVMIMDWDLHHGNGTQHSFYDSDSVLYCSTHQYPYYPGTGAVLETGTGPGEGYTVNVPLTGGQGDMEFACIFNELILPVARRFKPELIFISSGFDIYDGDPLGAMKVTPAGFAYMTRALVDLAAEICAGRLIVTLEGGYNLRGMKDGALAVLTELLGEQPGGQPEYLDENNAEQLAGSQRSTCALSSLDQVIEVVKTSWDI